MKRIIIFPALLFFAACDKYDNYQCACQEINNPKAQRHFGVFEYNNTDEAKAGASCKQKETEIKNIYGDSMMQASYTDTTKIMVADIVCASAPTHRK